MMGRTAAFLAMGLLFLTPAMAAESGVTSKPKHEYTNVILISLQCLRADHLGAYGYKRGTSSIGAF